MSYSLSSLKGGYMGDYIDIGPIRGDARSLDDGFHVQSYSLWTSCPKTRSAQSLLYSIPTLTVRLCMA